MLVLSVLIIWHDLYFFPNEIKTLLNGFDPYISFYLRCKCSTFQDARTLHYIMKRSNENCLIKEQKEEIYIHVKSPQLKEFSTTCE